MSVDQSPADGFRTLAEGRLESIQVSKGGVPKLCVAGPVEVTASGVQGDRQRNRRLHGGPDRAVCLFSREVIDAFRGEGHPIEAGTTGENLTISGLDWNRLAAGMRLAVGGLVMEVTKPAHPCKKIEGSFSDGDFSRMSAKIHPGQGRLYARVLQQGAVRAGDLVRLLERPTQSPERI